MTEPVDRGRRVSRRAFLGAGAATVAAAAAGVALGSREDAAPQTRSRFPEVYRERFLAGPREDHDPWIRPFHTRRWVYLEDRAEYHLPATVEHPYPYLPEPIWRPDRDIRDGDVALTLSVSNPTMGAGALFRGDGLAGAYAATLEPEGRIVLARNALLARTVLDGTDVSVDPTYPFRIRLEATGDGPVLVRARAWQDGLPEPEIWQVEAEDDGPDALTGAGLTGAVVLPAAPREQGMLTIRGAVARSIEFPTGSRAAIAYALAGPPALEDSGRYRVRLRARTGLPGRLSFEVGSTEDLADAEALEAVPREPGTSASATVSGLEGGRTWYWRVRARRGEGGPEEVGPVARFRTPPDPGGPVRFVFGSCTFPEPPHRSFATMAGLEPDFALHLGDLGYPHSSRWAASTPTPDAYTDRWTRLLAEPSFRRLQSVAPVGLQADDHDHGENNCWSETCPPWSVNAFESMHANPAPPYFSFRWGDVEVFVLQVRRFSDDPSGFDRPGKTRLGRAQRTWLERGMARSDASLLVVASPTPLRTRIPEDPSWETAFAEEREELLSFFLARPQRVVMVSGDAHGTRVMRYARAGSDREVVDHLCAGTEQGPDVGKEVDIHDPDGVTDPERFVPVRHDAFGWVEVAGGEVTMRSLTSEGGDDLFPPLVLPVAW